MRTAIRLVLGAWLVGLPAFVGAGEADRVYLGIVLDASSSMSERFVADEKTADSGKGNVTKTALGEESTRWSAARETITSIVTSLGNDDNQIGVWLFGHRLAWSEGAAPEMMLQDAYLEQTLGFQALARLLPGDDVERIQHLRPMRDEQHSELAMRLRVAQPWGDSPLFLSMVDALDEFRARSDLPRKGIVVLTSGRNLQQHLARRKTSRADVLETAARRGVPIHVVHFGAKPGDLEALRAITSQTGGKLMAGGDPQAVVNQLKQALLDEYQAPATPEDKTAGIAAAIRTLTGGVVATPAKSTSPRQVEGRVIFYGRPVRRAEVRIDDGELSVAKTDRDGRFVLKNVTPGTHLLKVKGAAKNLYRYGSLTIEVPAAPERVADVQVQLQ